MESPVTDTIQDAATALRRALVDTLVRDGHIRSPLVEAAFRAVPRHLFVPDSPLETVYSDTHIETKWIEGSVVNSSSQPTIMAIMLERLAIRPGQRVLEIGAGTGYNAALLAHIVGEQGQVVTIDIDEDIVAAARAHLAAAGYEHIQVICADGGLGHADLAPYDRIIATARAHDLPPAWWEQLRPAGRLVVPMGLTPMETAASEGAAMLATFDRIDDHLESRTLSYCGFIRLRGAFGVRPKRPVTLGPTPQLNLIVASPVEADRLYAALTGSHDDTSVGIAITPREMFGLRLWLVLHEPHFCDLWAIGDCSAQGIVPLFTSKPGTWVATVGVCDTATLSLLTYEPGQAPAAAEPFDADTARGLLVQTFGPDGEQAQRLIARIVAWDRAGRPFAFNEHWILEGPRLRVYPREPVYVPTADEAVITQRSAQLVFNWGETRPPL